ncbi:Hypothetical predicted protein [Mytilus galloprovincialis]|uniref:Uncharacterized protein n=1 Tax=Mytilus galloprovincialis TaxID=29158 RepID=A0A8B6GA67_MYTGA|nr:Hypothetical predicted protein [Mytilus galloprovincialis]
MIINLCSYLKEKLTGKSKDKRDVTLITEEKPKSTSTYGQGHDNYRESQYRRDQTGTRKTSAAMPTIPNG